MARLRGPRRRALAALSRGYTIEVRSLGGQDGAFLMDDGRRVALVPWRHAHRLIEAGHVTRQPRRTSEVYVLADSGWDLLAMGTSPSARRAFETERAPA